MNLCYAAALSKCLDSAADDRERESCDVMIQLLLPMTQGERMVTS